MLRPLPSAAPLHRRASLPHLIQPDPSLMLRERITLSPFPKPFPLLPPISCTKPSRPGGGTTHSDGGPPPAAPHAGFPPLQTLWPGPGSRRKERDQGVCAWLEGASRRSGERASPHLGSSAARGAPRWRGSSKGRADGVSPSHHFSLLNLSLSVLSFSVPPFPRCLPFSHLRRLERPAFPRSPARTPAATHPPGTPVPRPCPARPCPAPRLRASPRRAG